MCKVCGCIYGPGRVVCDESKLSLCCCRQVSVTRAAGSRLWGKIEALLASISNGR
jgi:hypothetical protein